ncbi:hypothetical protein GCM10028862_08140 [Luteimonas pelagia]
MGAKAMAIPEGVAWGKPDHFRRSAGVVSRKCLMVLCSVDGTATRPAPSRASTRVDAGRIAD